MAWIWLVAAASATMGAYQSLNAKNIPLFGLNASLIVLSLAMSVYFILAFDAAAKRQESN